jgi:transcriptional regulator with XRE-family HTH domain/predicted transcriptional regulator
MGNKYLERINRLYREIIVPNRVKFEENKWFKRDTKTNEWVELKVYKQGQVSLSHSKGTATYVSHLSFLLNNPGPYTLEQLVDYMYTGEFHKYYGWVEGFWGKETLLMYFQKLKENNEPLYEVYIRDHHNAFYKAIRRFYKCRRSFHAFLLDMGENPDEVSGDSFIDKFRREGKHIEFDIVRILKKLQAPYEYFVRFPSGVTPDLYNRESHDAIDIKRSIKTNIDKEIKIYCEEFNEVTVIYLLGSRELVTYQDGVKKMSIYRWIRSQSFFKNLSEKKQQGILRELDNIVKSIDEGQYNSDVHDYHKMLVEQIIQYDKDGLSNPQIAEKVGVSYKYVNRILRGKALQEYSGDYPTKYKEKQKGVARDKEIKKNKIIELFLQGVPNAKIAEQLDISIDMVRYHLRNAGLNQKELINRRNEKIHAMLNTFTNHETLSDKFQWIANSLKQDYPEISVGVIDNYYYSHFIRKEGHKVIIKGKDDIRAKVVTLFRSGRSRQEIAQALQIPVTSVREYLRKENLGKKDILHIRNEKIEQLLKSRNEYKTLKLKFESIANELKEEYPDVSARTIHTYYYTHFLKKHPEFKKR